MIIVGFNCCGGDKPKKKIQRKKKTFVHSNQTFFTTEKTDDCGGRLHGTVITLQKKTIPLKKNIIENEKKINIIVSYLNK